MPRRKTASSDVGVIYARYSSHAQKDASIEQQIEECQKYAKEHHIKIVELFADRAISGKTDQRPQFQRMMKEAEKGHFSCVIAWKSNRMGRNMLQAMVNEARLNDCGVRVLYTEEDFDDTAAGRFALRSMMNVNQFYSENMAEDIRRGMRDNAEKCLTNGSLPYGYRRGEDGRYALDPPKDDIVREIYARVACAEPFIDIARDLNLRGIRTKSGSEWNKGSFHTICTNERYRGIYIYGEVRVEGGVPRIVSDQMFFKVQEVLKTKKNAQGRHRVNGDYLLTGKLYCGKCKAPMTGISGKTRPGKPLYYYYTCQKRRMEHACDKKNLRRDDIELQVAKAIRDYALRDDIIEWIADSSVEYSKRQLKESSVGVLEQQLSETQRGIKNILSAIEQGVVTETTKGRLIELEAEQSRLTAKIEAEKADIIIVPREEIIEGLSIFKDGDINSKEYQAKLFDTFLVAVYVYDDENEMKIIFGFTGRNNTIRVPLDTSVVSDESLSEADSTFKLSEGPP